MKIRPATSQWFDEQGIRLDASYHLSEARQAKFSIDKSPLGTKTRSEVTERSCLGGRVRRVDVSDSERGYPYLTASDMTKAEPFSATYLSKTYTKNQEKLMIRKGWILLSCSGSIGRTVFTNELFEGQIGTHDLIRIVPDHEALPAGYLYAFLSSKYGYSLLTQGTYGGVIQHIEPHHIKDLPIPLLPEAEQAAIHAMIEEAAQLRVEANRLLEEAERELIQEAQLRTLTPDDYEYFGSHVTGRPVAAFTVKSSNPFQTTLTAFNHSVKIEKLKEEVKQNNQTLTLKECLAGGSIFSTGSFKRLETTSPKGVRLINQSDIFNFKIEGKLIAPKFVKNQDLVSYGEVIIAGVGTLGENETFCRVLFAGEELIQELISGEFIRMKTEKVPAGYLYAWLATQYGFRMIRACQGGTKLCRPIPRMLLEIPVPILEEDIVKSIDQKVVEAHSKRFEALQKETAAIRQVEEWIEAW